MDNHTKETHIMKAYPVSLELRDFIVAEQDRIYKDSRRLWNSWSPIEGADYLGLSSDEFDTVIEFLDRLHLNYQKRNLHNPLYLESLIDCIREVREMQALHKADEEWEAHLKDLGLA